ncbi:hypothetical protein ABPG72_000113 [Tetrahymena utriculariae]
MEDYQSSSFKDETQVSNSKLDSTSKSLKNPNDESQSDDKKSDDESETINTEFDVHQKGAILTLKHLIKLKRKPRKSKKIIVDLSNTKYEVIKQICSESFNWNITYRSNADWNIKWQDFYINEDDLRKMLPYQKINHFPGSYNLGKKNYLGKNLSKMRLKFPDDFDFCPRTWLLPYQYEDLRNFYEKNKSKKPVFIVKPEASCQGKGIYLVKKFSTLKQDQHMVVQEYIKNPFLIDGLKFDFRVYVLVKSVCPLKVFIYREGLARFATCKYSNPSKKNLRNMCMHLTNYAVNKHNPEFQFNSDANQDNIGHKRSFSSILKYLEDNGKDANGVFLQIKQIVNKTMCSVQPYLSHLYRSCQLKEENSEMCFEVFGFDIMLDDDLKAYLIEVNHTPSFTTDTPLDYHIKHSLITDTLILVDTRNKAKSNYVESKKQMIVGKSSVKMNQEDKENMLRKLDAYEHKYQNGYIKSIPADSDDNLNYEKFIQAAQSIHDEFTGTKRNIERLQTQQLPSTTSLQNQSEKKKQEQEAPNIPKPKNINIVRRPVSGIPLNLQKRMNQETNQADNYISKIANNTTGFLNQSFNQQSQNQSVNSYQPQAQDSQSQAQGNSSSSSSIQTVSALSQKSNTNHIIKNIRKISQRSVYKPSQNVVDYSVDSNQQTGSTTNIYSSVQNKNQNAIVTMNNYSREETSMLNMDKGEQQLKQFGSNNNIQLNMKPESGRQDLSYKLDQLKRELQIAKEEASRCLNEQESIKLQQLSHTRGLTQILENTNNNSVQTKISIRPQSSSIAGQLYRNNLNQNNQNQYNGITPLSSTSSRPLMQNGNKATFLKIKEDAIVRNTVNSNGTLVYIQQTNNSNTLQQNRNEFLSIQRVKIEPKLYANSSMNSNSNQTNTYLAPVSYSSSRVVNIPSLNGYSTNQNLNQNSANAYFNSISPKHYQNSITPSSQQFLNHANSSISQNILQEMNNKNMNIIIEIKDKSSYKSRGSSAIGGQRELKQYLNANQQQQNQQIVNQSNNLNTSNNINNNNNYSQNNQQHQHTNLRSNSYGNLHSEKEKGNILTVENAQTTTNATNYAQRKGLPKRSFKFDDKIQNLIQFNIEDEIQS